jgi:ABC-type cobalamin/Fe3+-siderophores transport system ATPase subunit
VRIAFELKNYRCFPDSRPARFIVRDGFVSFVGVNNAGKSSLLRFFYEFRQLFGAISQMNSPELLQALRGEDRNFAPQGLTDYAEVFTDTNDRDLTIAVSCSPEATPSGQALPDRLELIVRRTGQFYTARVRTDGEFVTPHGELGWNGENILVDMGLERGDLSEYIAAFAALAQTLYIGPFRNAINVGSNESYYDLRVGQAFIQAWNVFKTGGRRSDANAAIAVTEDIQRIFGFDSLEINASADGQSLQLFIDGRPYRLHELGAGIAHFIIVLAFVATQQPAFLMIDEPELNLHPALQLDFLTTLGSYATHGVLFATHLIGLARAGSQSIFSVRRIAQSESEVAEYEQTGRLSEFVGELGFSGYQELGFDKILLVEGPTDVTAFQRLLRLYGLEHKVLLVPLGGSSLINARAEPQLMELKRITENITALIDSERSEEGEPLAEDREGFRLACSTAEIECKVLDRRALENYFTEQSVQVVKGEGYRALRPFERLKDVEPSWAKAENWKIAGELTRAEVDGTDLGTFLTGLSNSA